jgi:hypothetical protein
MKKMLNSLVHNISRPHWRLICRWIQLSMVLLTFCSHIIHSPFILIFQSTIFNLQILVIGVTVSIVLASVFAMFCFNFHYLHMWHKLVKWHSVDALGGIKLLGMVGALRGVTGYLWYTFITLNHHVHKFEGWGGIKVHLGSFGAKPS